MTDKPKYTKASHYYRPGWDDAFNKELSRSAAAAFKPNHTIEEILELGDKRTPGKWLRDKVYNMMHKCTEYNLVSFRDKSYQMIGSDLNRKEDVDYIAAAPSMEAHLRILVEQNKEMETHMQELDLKCGKETTKAYELAIALTDKHKENEALKRELKEVYKLLPDIRLALEQCYDDPPAIYAYKDLQALMDKAGLND